jgi:hypothetical protein
MIEIVCICRPNDRHQKLHCMQKGLYFDQGQAHNLSSAMEKEGLNFLPSMSLQRDTRMNRNYQR